jgi:hypothetical protein
MDTVLISVLNEDTLSIIVIMLSKCIMRKKFRVRRKRQVCSNDSMEGNCEH